MTDKSVRGDGSGDGEDVKMVVVVVDDAKRWVLSSVV